MYLFSSSKALSFSSAVSGGATTASGFTTRAEAGCGVGACGAREALDLTLGVSCDGVLARTLGAGLGDGVAGDRVDFAAAPVVLPNGLPVARAFRG